MEYIMCYTKRYDANGYAGGLLRITPMDEEGAAALAGISPERIYFFVTLN